MHTKSTHENMMNTGKVLMGMALLVLSVTLMITPTGAAPLDAFPPVESGDASHAGSIVTIPPSSLSTYDKGFGGELVSAIIHPHAHWTGMLAFHNLHHVPFLLFERLGIALSTGNGGVIQ
jgi:hypothetical protein